MIKGTVRIKLSILFLLIGDNGKCTDTMYSEPNGAGEDEESTKCNFSVRALVTQFSHSHSETI